MAAHALSPSASTAAGSAARGAARQPHPTRAFGRFELRRLLGKSAATMVWLAFDPRAGRELMLTLPRVQPINAAALEAWQRDARAATRLDHPNIAPAAEIGVQDHWPFIAVDRSLGVTLDEWLAARPGHPPAAEPDDRRLEVARCCCKTLDPEVHAAPCTLQSL